MLNLAKQTDLRALQERVSAMEKIIEDMVSRLADLQKGKAPEQLTLTEEPPKKRLGKAPVRVRTMPEAIVMAGQKYVDGMSTCSFYEGNMYVTIRKTHVEGNASERLLDNYTIDVEERVMREKRKVAYTLRFYADIGRNTVYCMQARKNTPEKCLPLYDKAQTYVYSITKETLPR